MHRSINGARTIAALALVAMLVAGCSDGSSGGSSASTSQPKASSSSKPSRGAEDDRTAGDWALEFNIDVYNASTAPLEVGKIQQLSKDGEMLVTGGTWTATGGPATQVLKPATVDAAGQVTKTHLPLFIQMKDGRRSPTDRQSPVGPLESQDQLLLVFPTFQLRFVFDHRWGSERCTNVPMGGNFCYYHRVDSISMQARQRDGYQYGIGAAFGCLDPTSVTGDLGDKTKTWNGFALTGLNQINVEYRSAADMAKVANCYGAGRTISNVSMPGMSLSNGKTGPKLAGTTLLEVQMPGVDFRGLDMTGTSFGGDHRANLAYADFSGATLYGADFTNADLTGAKFDGAKVDDTTKFNGALLPFVDLSKANGSLRQKNVLGVGQCDTNLGTVLPDDPGTTTTTAAAVGLEPVVTGPNGICTVSFPSLLTFGGNVSLPMTATSVPMLLSGGDGDFDACPRPSTIGAHQPLPIPPNGCTTVLTSQNLPGGTGSVTVRPGAGGSGSASGTVAFTGGGQGYVLSRYCLAVDAVNGACPASLKPAS